MNFPNDVQIVHFATRKQVIALMEVFGVTYWLHVMYLAATK